MFIKPSLTAQFSCRLIAITALFCTINTKAAWQAQLSAQEVSTLSNQATLQHQLNNQARSVEIKNNSLSLEILMVELQELKSRTATDARLAEVFLFDYTTNTASVQLLDVDTQELVSSRHISNIHLPLNQNEANIALEILENNAEFVSTIEAEFSAQFGKPLTSLTQVDMKVSIWEPGINDEGSNCSQTRCALVSVFTHDYYNFSIEPVIELKDSVVHLDLVQ